MPKYWKRVILYCVLSGILIAMFGTWIGLGTWERFFLNFLSGVIIGGYYGNKERIELESASKQPRSL
jgi:hypothetical protein